MPTLNWCIWSGATSVKPWKLYSDHGLWGQPAVLLRALDLAWMFPLALGAMDWVSRRVLYSSRVVVLYFGTQSLKIPLGVLPLWWAKYRLLPQQLSTSTIIEPPGVCFALKEGNQIISWTETHCPVISAVHTPRVYNWKANYLSCLCFSFRCFWPHVSCSSTL